MDLLIATRNKKKYLEIKQLLKNSCLKVISLELFPDLPQIKETGKTFKENASIKAREVSRLTGKLTLGEDSGLCVDILNGKPGIYSSRFAGLHKSDDDNNKKLLNSLGNMPLSKRKAHYVCALSLADKGKVLKTFEGRCSGLIGFREKGSSGFGYDPLFIIPAYRKTFAQLGLKVKHKMSHRANALKKLKAFLPCLKPRLKSKKF